MDNGTILAAVISAAAASLGVTLAKDGKVSEFRQAWIDALREDVSEMIALTVRGYEIRQAKYHQTYVAVDGDENVTERANIVMYRILLRLDTKMKKKKKKWIRNDRHCELSSAVSATREVAANAPLDNDVMSNAAQRIQLAAIAVLDQAWERVKSGEPLYRWARRISFGALGLSLVILAIQPLWNRYHKTENPVTQLQMTQPVVVDVHQQPPTPQPPPPVPVTPENTLHPAQSR